MTHEIDQPIKRRPDGSIDIQHYVAQGHQARSQQAHDIAKNGVTAPVKAASKIKGFLSAVALQRLFKYASSAKY